MLWASSTQEQVQEHHRLWPLLPSCRSEGQGTCRGPRWPPSWPLCSNAWDGAVRGETSASRLTPAAQELQAVASPLLSALPPLPQSRSTEPCTGLCFQWITWGQLASSELIFPLKSDYFFSLTHAQAFPGDGPPSLPSVTHRGCRHLLPNPVHYLVRAFSLHSTAGLTQSSNSFQEGSSKLTIVQTLRTLPQTTIISFCHRQNKIKSLRETLPDQATPKQRQSFSSTHLLFCEVSS